MCCVGTLEDLAAEGLLRPVAEHLSGRALQALRSTCQSFRHHPDILTAVTRVSASMCWRPKAAEDLDFLARLSSLKYLGLPRTPCLFHMHRLSSLQLRELELDNYGGKARLGMQPLVCLTALRTLVLAHVRQPTSLDRLSQLTELSLFAIGQTSGLGKLTGLLKLGLRDRHHCNELRSLPGLTWVELLGLCNSEVLSTATHHLRRARNLSVLGIEVVMQPTLPGHLSPLTQLRSLSLDFEQLDGPQPDLRLSPLVSLKRLVLRSHDSRCPVSTPSVTCIELSPQSDLQLPNLTACTGLAELRLLLVQPCVCVLDSERLPTADRLSLRPPLNVVVRTGSGGRVFTDPCVAEPALCLCFSRQLVSLLREGV